MMKMCITKKCLYSLIIFNSLFQFSKAAFLRCYNGSLDKYQVTPLDKPLEITSCFNLDLPTVFYTFGYRGRVNGPATTAVLTAYIKNKKRNVVLLDWEAEAQSGLLGIPLGYALSALPNAKKIGRELGNALIQLSKAGMDLRNVHLMGHSLGAHIMGFAGRGTRAQDHTIARITGLDPARALFEGTLGFQAGLDRTCATFVDIVHTDPGGYGTSSSSGTVDIWPNYTGSSDGGTQPGCPTGDFEMFSQDDLCNHDRSWKYYVEALGSPTSFPASGAANVDEWSDTDGLSNYTVYLGELTNPRAKGNFYLRTNSEPPYGLGVEGQKPDGEPRTSRNYSLTRIFKYL